jgi:Spy/CpxP family protein refolding chaperone
MRKIVLVTLAALSLAACSSDTTSPDLTDPALDAGTFGTAMTLAGGYEADLYQERLINALPDDLELSDNQKTQLSDLVRAFEESTKADRDALRDILHEARKAVEGRKGHEEVQAILRKGDAIRDRLNAAGRKLVADIDALLTAEQRAWISAHKPASCRAENFPPLTDAQKSQIRDLERNFRDTHKADLDAMKKILAEAKDALRSGDSRDDVAAILARALPIANRLATARKDLRDDILAVLTPQQRASRCFPLG